MSIHQEPEMICIMRGTTRFGLSVIDQDGNRVQKTPATFTQDPEGGSIAIFGSTLENPGEPDEPMFLHGDYDIAGILETVNSMLEKTRGSNLPNFKDIIIKAWKEDRVDLCDYCDRIGCNCGDCIIHEWMEEIKENQPND